MKKLFFAGLFFITNFIYAQDIKVEQIKDQSIVKTLPFIENMTISRGKKLYLSVFMVNNGSGSAHFSGSDEVSYNLLISVSTYDEHPKAKIFTVGPFTNPKLVSSKDQVDNYSITVEHDIYHKRSKKTLLVYSNRIE